MSYQSIREMASSQSLIARVAAAAAEQGVTGGAVKWAQDNIWKLAASPGWDDAWDYAKATETDDVNPDTGMRPGVISDAMILSAVQPMVSPPAP